MSRYVSARSSPQLLSSARHLRRTTGRREWRGDTSTHGGTSSSLATESIFDAGDLAELASSAKCCLRRQTLRAMQLLGCFAQRSGTADVAYPLHRHSSPT